MLFRSLHPLYGPGEIDNFIGGGGGGGGGGVQTSYHVTPTVIELN